MDTAALPWVTGLMGAVMGALVALLLLRSSRRRGDDPNAAQASPHPDQRELTPTAALTRSDLGAQVVHALRSAAMVVDPSDAVVHASPAARSLGLIAARSISSEPLREIIRTARRDGGVADVELDLPRAGGVGAPRPVRARATRLDDQHVLLVVDDLTTERQVDAVRRDFIVNVSHELKTPVGGLALLAEAVTDASDDPEAVARFAQRMQHESQRLSRLVKDIVDLSRLQGEDPAELTERVDVAAAVTEAVDNVRVSADANRIQLTTVLDPGVEVLGSRDLIVTALRNLLANAVSYSEAGTKVVATSRAANGFAEIAVTDQGVGIQPGDQQRIFERFYRVDAARSRATGGTGLGLSIVKHICDNHGGSVRVWSRPNEGSTFTVRLPLSEPTAEEENRSVTAISRQEPT